jgi:hypothetical protein
MNKYYKIVILAILINFSLAINSKPLLALKCDGENLTFSKQRKMATAIFTGKVIKIVDNGYTPLGYESSDVIFQVAKVWKGSPRKTIKLIIDDCSSSSLFKVNDEYLVYTSGDEKYLNSASNSRSRLLANAGEDLRALGTGKTPSIDDSPEPTKSSSASPTTTRTTTKPSMSSNIDNKASTSSRNQSSSSQSSSLPMIAAIAAAITASITSFYLLRKHNSKPK